VAATVTILFTDLVGSTALATSMGEEEAEQLRRAHFQLLRNAVAASGGMEVKNLGDGLMVAFTGVRDAVDCAVAIQQGIDRHNRRGTQPPLAIRVGISTGDAVSEDGDWFGIPVIEAARLCAACAGGEILCAEVVRVLAGGRGGHAFEPVGPLQLRGLPDPVPTWCVRWEPAIGALPLPPGVRFEFSSPFVGRARERAALDAAWRAVAAGERRVVLLEGDGGSGASRLAIEVALAAHAQGATVLFGRCDEELGGAYQPFGEALRH